MIVTTLPSGEKMGFSFTHTRAKPAPSHKWYKSVLYLRVTFCEIFKILPENKGVELVGDGESLCSPVEQFRKDVGRKISLTRALEVVFPKEKSGEAGKAARTAIWMAYLNRGNAIVGAPPTPSDETCGVTFDEAPCILPKGHNGGHQIEIEHPFNPILRLPSNLTIDKRPLETSGVVSKVVTREHPFFRPQNDVSWGQMGSMLIH